MRSSQPDAANANTPRAGDTRRALVRLAAEWWTLRSRIARAYAATLLAVLATLAQPWPLKLLIDDVLPATADGQTSAVALPEWIAGLHWTPGRAELALLLAAAIGLATWLAAIAGARERMASAGIREAFGVQLRDLLLAHVLRLGHGALAGARRGELVLRLVDDVGRVNRLFNKSLPQVVRHALGTVGLVAILFGIDWRIGAMAAALTVALALVARAQAGALQRAAHARRHREGEVAGLAQEVVNGVEHVQVNGAEARIRARFRAENERSFAAGIAETESGVVLERRLQVLGGCAVAAIAGAGALLVLDGALTLGTLTVCVAYMTQLLKPVEKLNDLAADITQGSVRATRLLQLLETAPAIRDEGSAVPDRSRPLCLCLEDVGYAYPTVAGTAAYTATADAPVAASALVFQGLHVRLQQGEIVALTGANGSGKSTLVRLLLRLMEPTQGRLLLDDVPYSHFRLDALRQSFAVSAQTHQSFAGSIRDLLRGIEPDAGEEALWQALHEVRMDEHVRALPAGLDARLGENANDLSGGQRARLALAAALLANRPVLVLDEPFANVDDASRQVILEALARGRPHRLCIAITHEQSLIAIADRTLRLDAGQLVALPPTQTGDGAANASATTATSTRPIVAAASDAMKEERHAHA